MLSRVWLFVTLWTVACQAPLSVEFSRQEYWSGLPFPSPVNLPGGKAGIENTSLAPVALEGGFLTLHYQGSPKSTRGQPKAPFNRKAKLRTFLTVTNCYKKATGSTKDVHPRQWSSIAVWEAGNRIKVENEDCEVRTPRWTPVQDELLASCVKVKTVSPCAHQHPCPHLYFHPLQLMDQFCSPRLNQVCLQPCTHLSGAPQNSFNWRSRQPFL